MTIWPPALTLEPVASFWPKSAKTPSLKTLQLPPAEVQVVQMKCQRPSLAVTSVTTFSPAMERTKPL